MEVLYLNLNNDQMQPITLRKGGTLNLRKGNKQISRVMAGLGWKGTDNSGEDIDLDVSAFILGKNGKVLKDGYVVFYLNEDTPCGAIHHMGDDRKGGSGNTDDEQIIADLDKLPPEADRLRSWKTPVL